MHFIDQIKKQFISASISYVGPEGATDTVDEPIDTPESAPGSDIEGFADLAEQSGETAEVIGNRADVLSQEARNLTSSPEGNKDVAPLSSSEVLENIEFKGNEEELARQVLGENASDEEVKQQVFDTRVAALESNTITDGEREIIEGEFITEIAEESGIDPELIGDLRSLGFDGAQDWDQGDIAANLEDMAEQLKAMKDQIEANGGTFPKTKEEFLALYAVMSQNDEIGDTQAVNPADAEASGLDIVRDADGNIGINPEGEGVQVVGDTVVAPNGAYSRGGNVYAPANISGSDVGGNISVAPDQLSQITPPNSSPELEAYGNEHNKEIIKNRVPAEWHGAAIKMAQKIGTMQEGKVIALSSMENKEAVVCYPDGSIHTFPIIIGETGYAQSTVEGDKKTPVDTVFNFNSGKVAGRGNDASQGGSSTVLGGAVYSPEAGAMGGRWWHGVADRRIPGGATHGCIGATQENIMKMARAVNEHGGGYGMNVVTKRG